MVPPASFEDFLGNRDVVSDLRASIAAGRLPNSTIIAGSGGAGKYTLALLLTLALACERQPRRTGADGRELASFCGECRNCTRVAQAADLQARVDEAIAAREEMRETDKKDTRILVQTHTDVLIVPPDPPQMLIKLGQIRTMIARAQYVPTEAPVRVFIITSGAFMKEAANSLLKLLEEPPDRVYLMLLAENTGELLPTIRSRCAVVRLGALSPQEIASLLAERRPELRAAERDLVGRLAEGAAGRALGFDLATYLPARADALTMLATLEHSNDHSPLFRMTESYRAGAEGQEKLSALLRAMGSLLEDVLLVRGGAPQAIRNVDRREELLRLAEVMDFPAIEAAVRGLDAVRTGMRRNLLRSLSLDSFALGLSDRA